MSVVLDNSVAIEWLLAPDDGSGAARLMRRHAGELQVPAIFWTELLYVLGKYVGRGLIDRAFRDTCLGQVRRLGVVTDLDAAAPGACLDHAQSLGDQHGLTIYDAVYLELALRSKARLMTFDRELAEAARSCRVEVLDA